MYNKKSGLVNRAFSVVLALLMVLSILPITAFASTSVNVDSFTVCVKDSVNNADINDASIEYKVLIDQNVKEDNTVKTNEGEAVIAEMKNYEQDIADGKTVTFEYSVSADGYVTKTGKADVTDVNDNIDVKLEKKVVETVPITVNKNGSGTVKINNEEVTDSKAVEKDSTVELEVTPAKDTYIKKLVIGGETKSVEKGKSYRNSFKVSDALTVEVTFVKEYTVSIDKNAGGSVKLDKDSSENQLFDEGTKTNLTVSADEGYQILSVSINGEDETVTDTSKFNFNKELTVNSDIAIKVEFVKVYTVKVSWDKNGNVSVRPALTQGDGTPTEGTVVVKKDGIVSITATPSETYRVSSVKINGEEISYDDNRFNANKSYKWEQTGVAMDYEIEITFAPILCKIDVNAGENGSVTADKSEVNYGESTNITITANKGYCIDEVKVNGEDKKTSVTRSGENTYKLSIENITSESNKVSVSFKKYSEMESGDYKWDKDDAIRSSSDGTFVFNKDAAVVFSTEKNGIELIFDDKTSIGGYGIKSVEITDTETVKEVIVYKNETEISSEEFDNLKIVIDKAAPNPKIGAEGANENGYYNSDFNVTLSAKDSDAYSGISKLEYWVYKNGETVTAHDVLYSYKSGDEILQEKSVDDVKIDAEKNNSDNVKIVLKVTDLAGNENGYYNKNVNVNVKVDEMSSNCSGIKNVHYEVRNGNEVTKSGNLYNFDVKNPTKSQLEQKIPDNKYITVDAEKNNSDNIKVIVKAVDNAGNQSESSVFLNINKTNPTISVKFDNNDLKFAENERGYFNANRTATVTITDRFSTFDANAATDGIKISGKGIDGNEISLDKTKMISKWDTNGDTHTAYVKFDEDANYDWSVSYQNKAGKSAEKVDVSEQKTPYKFTVDTKSPSLKLKINEKNIWSKLLQTITFGIWSQSDVEVTANAKDDISPIKSVSYFKYNGDTALGDKELDKLYNEGEFKEYNNSITVSPGEQAVIYGRVEDYAGNYTYVSSNGIIADNKAPEITFDVSPKNKYGEIYNGDVDVTVGVKDVCSGIKNVHYEVINGNEVTQSEDLYNFNVKSPTKSQLETEISKLITVDAERNNSDDVKVVVTATDNAGNKTKDDEHTISLVIDKTPPEINVKYNSTANNGAKNGYYTSRTATVTVTERSSHFDGADATKGIIISAVDAKNNKVSDAYKISGWTTVENDSNNHDKDTHTATIKFEKDANYTFAVSYTDKAGNANDGVDVSGQNNPYKFTVDKTSPTGSLKAKSAEGQETEWSELRKTLTFGFWSKKKITVTGSQNDKTSPIAKVEYYKVKAKNATDGTTPLTKAQLDNVTSWAKFSSLEVRPNEQCAVYVKITDYAGNYTYISTNGLIADNKKPREESVAPQVTVNPQQPLNGFYKGNVKVSISVNDPLTGGTYSGLKEVSYRVYSQNILTQEGTLYSFNKSNPKQSDLRSKWTGSITVDSAKNNSNDVRVVVYAKDNAANDSEGVAKLKIDTTAPRIDVSYDNNSADSNSYFKAGRTARIVVTERNFNPDDVVVKITNTDGNIPRISNWTKTVGTGNQDDTRWTATIPYTADGDYHFSIAYTDLAGNKCSGENYATGTVAAKSFTIDKTAPTITVSYDNNSARNGNYYKADRTATVTIIEHNFDVNRVNASFSAGDKKLPNMSGWSSSGDQHTATIAYSSDGYYSFDISVKDKAGNDSAKFNTQSFYIDKTAPTLEITGVKNNSAYSGDILPVVSYSDDNYDDNNVSIKLVGANRDNVDLEGYYDDQINGKKFIFYDFEKEKKVDDIYTLTATLTDKAGNTSTKSVAFSANRFGSTYAFDSATKKLNGAYSKSVKDIVVTETNVNKLNNIKITLFKNSDTIKLKNGTDYRIDVEGGNGKWYKYVYTIFAKNFSDDGVYRLSFHSEDAAGNISENTLDTKNKEIRFGVDKTKPNVVLDNLESGQTYPLEKLKVSMIANDNLLLNSVVVYLDNYDKAYKTWDAKEIADILGKNGEFTFDVSGNSTGAHKMKVVCTDAAGNKITKEIKDFYVTTNLFIRYYNNKLLFFGSIAGFLLIVGVIVYAIVRKKKAK